MNRNEFMELVYETFADEPDNVLANRIIEAADAYVEHEKAQLSQEGTTSDQTVATDTNVGDKISKFIDDLEKTFAYIREREGGDSVCGLCEYDGAYIGESGDWCNECPGFNRDNCFKLSDETRRKWTDEIIKALPTIQPVATDTNVGDKISRQAAIDAFEDTTFTKNEIRRRLSDLPTAQPETAKRIVGKSRDGMTLWYQCDMCNEPVDEQDNYCRECGRRLIDG